MRRAKTHRSGAAVILAAVGAALPSREDRPLDGFHMKHLMKEVLLFAVTGKKHRSGAAVILAAVGAALPPREDRSLDGFHIEASRKRCFFFGCDGAQTTGQAQPSAWLRWERHCRPGRIGRLMDSI